MARVFGAGDDAADAETDVTPAPVDCVDAGPEVDVGGRNDRDGRAEVVWRLKICPERVDCWVVLPLPVVPTTVVEPPPPLTSVLLPLPFPLDTLLVVELLLVLLPPKLRCGLMMLKDRKDVWTVLPFPVTPPTAVVPDPPVEPTVVLLLLPLPADMLPTVVLLLVLLPPKLHCGLMMLPDPMAICVVLPLPTAAPTMDVPAPEVTVVLLLFPLPVATLLTDELLLVLLPPMLTCGLMTLYEKMST